jgi:hypothetical protein
MNVCEDIKKTHPNVHSTISSVYWAPNEVVVWIFDDETPTPIHSNISVSGNNPPLELVLNHLLWIKVHFDEFQSKLKVNEEIRVEVMKILQAMNEKMFCLVKIHDLNLTTLPHKSSHAFLKIKMYYV